MYVIAIYLKRQRDIKPFIEEGITGDNACGVE
jgi:hypothetical protein